MHCLATRSLLKHNVAVAARVVAVAVGMQSFSLNAASDSIISLIVITLCQILLACPFPLALPLIDLPAFKSIFGLEHTLFSAQIAFAAFSSLLVTKRGRSCDLSILPLLA